MLSRSDLWVSSIRSNTLLEPFFIPRITLRYGAIALIEIKSSVGGPFFSNWPGRCRKWHFLMRIGLSARPLSGPGISDGSKLELIETQFLAEEQASALP